MSDFVDISLPVPLRRAFTYRVPEGASYALGARVAVPFHRRKLAGFVVGHRDARWGKAMLEVVRNSLEVLVQVPVPV